MEIKKLGITPVSPIFKTAKWIALPASNYYQIAEDENQSLLDLANISILKNRDDARREFYEISNADRALFLSSGANMKRGCKSILRSRTKYESSF